MSKCMDSAADKPGHTPALDGGLVPWLPRLQCGAGHRSGLPWRLATRSTWRLARLVGHHWPAATQRGQASGGCSHSLGDKCDPSHRAGPRKPNPTPTASTDLKCVLNLSHWPRAAPPASGPRHPSCPCLSWRTPCPSPGSLHPTAPAPLPPRLPPPTCHPNCLSWQE